MDQSIVYDIILGLASAASFMLFIYYLAQFGDNAVVFAQALDEQNEN